jgi:hypothetical protein
MGRRANPLRDNKAWLFAHYFVAGKHEDDIAVLAGSTGPTVRGWLARNRIPVRPPEFKAAMREATRARLSALTKAAHARGDFAHIYSMPSRSEKLSSSLKRHYSDPANREAIAESTRQGMSRPEVRENLSVKAQERWDNMSPEEKAELYDNPERSQKLSAAQKKAWQRPGYRQFKSDQAKQAWENGAYDGVDLFPHGPTSIEVKVSEALDFLGIQHISQWRPKGIRFIYDEYLPELGVVIEVQGDYWHSSEEARKHDKVKAKTVRELGLRHAEIWEHELLKGDPVGLVERVVS